MARESMSKESREYDRRRFLKGAGLASTAGLTGLAGCAGNPDGGGTAGGTTETTIGNGGGGETTETDMDSTPVDEDFSGLTITYWSQIHTQSRRARQAVDTQINRFKQLTGASMRVNYSTYGDIIGAKWITQFKNGNIPHVYDAGTNIDAHLHEGGFTRPLSEYEHLLSEETQQAIEWAKPILRNIWRGIGDDKQIWGVPYATNPRAPFLARMDHFEEAGLDPENDYPPTNYDELVEVATTLQEEGPADFGFEVWGNKFDVMDENLPQWTASLDAERGRPLNEDQTESNYDNEVWVERFTQYVNIFKKHGLSSPRTPTGSDEAWMQALIEGSASMAQPDFALHPALVKQAPDMMSDGTLKWAPAWSGPANQRAAVPYSNIVLPRAPDSANKDEWEKKQRAAVKFIDLWLKENFQTNMLANLGQFPINKNALGLIPEQKNNVISTARTMMENSSTGMGGHPQNNEIMFNIPGRYVADAFKGNITPEEACNKMASDVNDLLEG